MYCIRFRKGKGKEVVVIPDEEKEVVVCGSDSLSLASQGICEAAAKLTNTPLFRHIAKLKFEEVCNRSHS